MKKSQNLVFYYHFGSQMFHKLPFGDGIWRQIVDGYENFA